MTNQAECVPAVVSVTLTVVMWCVRSGVAAVLISLVVQVDVTVSLYCGVRNSDLSV